MTVFFDSSVLFAVLKDTDTHHVWSVEQLEVYKAQGPVVIADIVYCELSYDLPKQEDVDAVVTSLALERLPHNGASLFRASKAYRHYREAHSGPKLNVLPDFLIGALAEVSGAPLVTANPKDIMNYFPKVTLIAPPATKRTRRGPHRQPQTP